MDLLTVTPEGNLEIRGKGWGPTIRSKNRIHHDRVHICKLKSKRAAHKIAEMVAILSSKLVEKDSKNFYQNLQKTQNL